MGIHLYHLITTMDIDEDTEIDFTPSQEKRILKATEHLRTCNFEQLCHHYTEYFRSEPLNRKYPPHHDTQAAKHSFRSRLLTFQWNEGRQRLFKKQVDNLKRGNIPGHNFIYISISM